MLCLIETIKVTQLWTFMYINPSVIPNSHHVHFLHGPPSVFQIYICSITERIMFFNLAPVALSEFFDPFLQPRCLCFSPHLQHNRNVSTQVFTTVTHHKRLILNIDRLQMTLWKTYYQVSNTFKIQPLFVENIKLLLTLLLGPELLWCDTVIKNKTWSADKLYSSLIFIHIYINLPLDFLDGSSSVHVSLLSFALWNNFLLSWRTEFVLRPFAKAIKYDPVHGIRQQQEESRRIVWWKVEYIWWQTEM